MKTFYPMQIIDLSLQVDHINPKKFQLFDEYRDGPANARRFVILIRHSEIKIVSDRYKIFEIKLFKMTIFKIKFSLEKK